MSQNKEKTLISKYRIDIIVIVSLLFISLIFVLVLNFTKKEGAYVEVTIDGETVGKYPLSVDASIPLNGGTNILTIKDGSAYMSYSNCPDHTCEHTGCVKHVGQTIICLPNRLTITVIGTSNDPVDFMS